MSTNIIKVYNGIEFKDMGDGTVEIFCDRPAIARTDELIKLFSAFATQTSKEVENNCHSFESHHTQHEVIDHTVEPALDLYSRTTV